MTDEDQLEAIAEEYLQSIRDGHRPPTVEHFCERHPSLSQEIRDLLQSLSQLEKFAAREESRKTAQADSLRIPKLPSQRLGDFDLIRLIGHGGMGEVYLAQDRSLNRRVALKVMTSRAPDRAARFQREARLASRLHHTNIIPVYGVGKVEDVSYFAMQFIDGPNLRQIIDVIESNPHRAPEPIDGRYVSDWRDSSESPTRHIDSTELIDPMILLEDASTDDPRKAETLVAAEQPVGHHSGSSLREDDTPLQNATEQFQDAMEQASNPPNRNRNLPSTEYWKSVAKIGLDASSAIAYAHENGVIHRDIKPGNLLIDRNGKVWVNDFGLAKLRDDTLTKTGDVLGTLRYMAPEQLEGRSDERSDLYSLGLTLYELLILRASSNSDSHAGLVAQKTRGQFPKPRSITANVPRDLATIVMKAMAAEPKDRYASASAMNLDLERFLNNQPITARKISFTEQTVRWCKKNPSAAALLGLTLALFVIVPASLWSAFRREAKFRQETENKLQIALDTLDEIFATGLQSQSHELRGVVALNLEATPLRITPETGEFLSRLLAFYDRLARENAEASPRLLAESGRAFHRVGDIYQALGNYSRALDGYLQAEKRYASVDSEILAEFQNDMWQLQIAKGRVLHEMGDSESAINQFETLLSQLPSNPKRLSDRLPRVQAHLLSSQSSRHTVRPSLNFAMHLSAIHAQHAHESAGETTSALVILDELFPSMPNLLPPRGNFGFDFRPPPPERRDGSAGPAPNRQAPNRPPRRGGFGSRSAHNEQDANRQDRGPKPEDSLPENPIVDASRPPRDRSDVERQPTRFDFPPDMFYLPFPFGMPPEWSNERSEPASGFTKDKMASGHVRAALEYLDTFTETEQKRPAVRYLRALVLSEMAGPFDPKRRRDRERNQAENLLLELVEEFPGHPEYSFALSSLYRDSRTRDLAEREFRPVVERLHKARNLLEELTNSHSRIAAYRINLAHVYSHLGMLYSRRELLDDAIDYSRKAVANHQMVSTAFPGLADTSRELQIGPSFSLVHLLLIREKALVMEMEGPNRDTSQNEIEIDAEAVRSESIEVLAQLESSLEQLTRNQKQDAATFEIANTGLKFVTLLRERL